MHKLIPYQVILAIPGYRTRFLIHNSHNESRIWCAVVLKTILIDAQHKRAVHVFLSYRLNAKVINSRLAYK